MARTIDRSHGTLAAADKLAPLFAGTLAAADKLAPLFAGTLAATDKLVAHDTLKYGTRTHIARYREAASALSIPQHHDK